MRKLLILLVLLAFLLLACIDPPSTYEDRILVKATPTRTHHPEVLTFPTPVATRVPAEVLLRRFE